MIQILLIAVLSLLAQFMLPWWSVAIIAFLVCFWRSERAGQSFFYGFYGIAIVWLVYAFILHSRTDGSFTGRMGELLFKTNNASLPVIVTAIVGGLVGGLSGLSGYCVRQAMGNQTVKATTRRSRS